MENKFSYNESGQIGGSSGAGTNAVPNGRNYEDSCRSYIEKNLLELSLGYEGRLNFKEDQYFYFDEVVIIIPKTCNITTYGEDFIFADRCRYYPTNRNFSHREANPFRSDGIIINTSGNKYKILEFSNQTARANAIERQSHKAFIADKCGIKITFGIHLSSPDHPSHQKYMNDFRAMNIFSDTVDFIINEESKFGDAIYSLI